MASRAPELHSANHWASVVLLAVSSLGTVLLGIWCLKPYKDRHEEKGRGALLRRYVPLGAWILVVLGVSIWAGERWPRAEGGGRPPVVELHGGGASDLAKPQ